MPPSYAHKKVAVVFSGGAARGFVHLGVIKALEEMQIRPTTIVGTSMGGIVGAYYAVYKNYENARRIMGRHKWYKTVTFKDFLGNKKGLVKGKHIRELFLGDIGDITFRKLDLQLIMNASDVISGENVVLRSGSVVDAMRCTMGIPLIYEPVRRKIGGKFRELVDGGLTSNLFFDILIPRAKDFDLIILVNLNSQSPPYKKKMNMIDFAFHNFYIYQYRQVKLSLDALMCDQSKNAKEFKKRMVILSPDMKGARGFEFKEMDKFIRMGYRCFKNKLPDIKKVLSRKSL
jgi:NTE family protein